MKKLIETKPILHTMIWILVYIVGVNIGDGFEAQTGIPNLVTAMFLMGLSVILIMYLKHNGWVERFGLKPVRKADMKQALYYVPLVLLVLIQFASGIDPALSMTEIAVFCLLMAGVGFIEELLFRGFLYQAIEGRSGVKRAVLISGVTFGLGHIVNLMRGYGYAEQVGQVVVAVAIGITLALIAARTRNIVPGIIFHILFNVSGSVTRQDAGLQTILAALIVVISLSYAFYLSKSLQHGREAEKSGAPQSYRYRTSHQAQKIMKRKGDINMKLLIHDLDEKAFQSIFPEPLKDVMVISDDGTIKPCIGCFSCWTKTPGECVLRDNYTMLGEYLSKSDEYILISKCTYGGFSPFVKNAVDRGLSYGHPYFEIRNGEMHHRKRYDNQMDMKVCFYGEDVTEAEKRTAEGLVKANCINLDCNLKQLTFVQDPAAIRGGVL